MLCRLVTECLRSVGEKEAVIEVRTCQTTIAILPPRGYFPQDVSSVETRRLEAERRPGLLAWLMNDAALLTAEPAEKPQAPQPRITALC